ncbi:MAG TPA: amidohydrolase [Chloroflexota bacterium]|nr:amidohydrolase [Chloroflexota bacterium]
MPRASLVLRNGVIRTLDRARPRASALAARGEEIVAVGDDRDVGELIGPQTAVLDLGGRAAIPGLIDAHVHLLWLGFALGQVELRDAATIGEAVARVAAHRGDGEWVVATGWDPNRWPRWPTRHDLDGLLPDRPVALWSHDLHSLWANSAALRRAGITAATAPPEGGQITRDPQGEPTGVLRERAAELVTAAIGQPSSVACDAATRRAVRRANELGLTGAHTMEGPEARAALQRLREDGGLTLRVCAHLARGELEGAIGLGLRTGFGDDWLRIGGLKLFADGALGSQTALMLEPYEGQDRNRGVEVLTPEELRRDAERAAANGIALTVHAIGDLANRRVLDAIALARRAGGPRLRHRIEHAQLVHPADLARFAELGVVASVQPVHATSDMATAERFWGARTRSSYAWRSLLDARVRLAFGTDCPVEPLDPIATIHAAVTRRRADGTPPAGWHPEQRLTVEESVCAYTHGSAYAAGEEGRKGGLAVGKLADVTVLSRDPLAVAEEELLGLRVEATVVGGRVVYQR